MNRFEMRKSRTHESILAAATALIGEKGLDGLSLEEVADKADVSRATLYNHYADKGRLLLEALEPIFHRALDRVDGMLRDPDSISLESICELCLDLWERHEERFGLVDPRAPPERGLGDLHDAFASRFTALFVPLSGRISFRVPDAKTTGMLVYRCFVPVLDVIAGMPNHRALFLDVVSALVSPDAGSGPSGRAGPILPRRGRHGAT